MSEKQADITGKDDLCSNDADREGSPMSPRTLVLMCDEKDVFIPDASSVQIMNRGFTADVYVEQEKLVLSKFRDCLTMLITRANIKET